MTEYIVDAAAIADGVLLRRSHVRGEIVRCRDCRHNDGGECEKLSHYLEGRYDCPHSDGFWWVEPDDYCIWGERRVES